MKKFSMLLAVVTLFAGCTHIKVVGFDKQANTVSVQGGKWASEESIQKEAGIYCNGPVTLLNMGDRTVGSSTTYDSGYATSVGIKRYVYTYSCNNH